MINTEHNLKLTGDSMLLNGYNIFWNDYWGEWHVTHDVVGLTPFNEFEDAITYAENG